MSAWVCLCYALLWTGILFRVYAYLVPSVFMTRDPLQDTTGWMNENLSWFSADHLHTSDSFLCPCTHSDYLIFKLFFCTWYLWHLHNWVYICCMCMEMEFHWIYVVRRHCIVTMLPLCCGSSFAPLAPSLGSSMHSLSLPIFIFLNKQPFSRTPVLCPLSELMTDE